MTAERFVVRSYRDLTKEQQAYCREDSFHLIDTETGRVVGSDGGEPEDQLLVRDWSWVVEELNALASALTVVRSERDQLRTQCDGCADAETRIIQTVL